ncbi:MAG TPA: hypothetical protein VNT53_06555 [Pseudolysinimonas sp.]|nr:hypothetical protein [Pseudolysinimonas sp.]
MHSRAARLARGWLLGTFATATAALSHTFAGGGTPSGVALVIGVVFAGFLGTFATGRTPSLPRLSVAVGGSQLAFHLLFSHLGSSPGARAAVGAHMHHTATAATAAAALPSSAPVHHSDMPWMWLAHTVAAVATLLFLLHAERTVWAMLTQLVHAVRAPFHAPLRLPVRAAHRIPVAASQVPFLVGRLLGTAVSRRGPPLFA